MTVSCINSSFEKHKILRVSRLIHVRLSDFYVLFFAYYAYQFHVYRSLGDVVCTPVIGVVASNVKRFKQGFEFFEYLILALAKHISQHDMRGMINGVPQPTLVRLVTYIRLLFVHLNLAGSFQFAVCA